MTVAGDSGDQRSTGPRSKRGGEPTGLGFSCLGGGSDSEWSSGPTRDEDGAGTGADGGWQMADAFVFGARRPNVDLARVAIGPTFFLFFLEWEGRGVTGYRYWTLRGPSSSIKLGCFGMHHTITMRLRDVSSDSDGVDSGPVSVADGDLPVMVEAGDGGSAVVIGSGTSHVVRAWVWALPIADADVLT